MIRIGKYWFNLRHIIMVFDGARAVTITTTGILEDGQSQQFAFEGTDAEDARRWFREAQEN